METNFIWKIEGLTKDQKQDIKEKILEKMSSTGNFKGKSIEIYIDKDPKNGAIIKVSDGHFILEGRYQADRISGPLVIWAENPKLGISCPS